MATVTDRPTAPPSVLRPSRSTFTADAIRELADAFERAEVSPDAWTHEAHLVVSLWLLQLYGPEEGGERVRAGIQRLNAAHGVPQTPDRGYHETITRFYLWAIRRHLRDAPPDSSLTDLAATLVAVWGDRNRPFEYYSRERLMSRDARTGWVEPDLREMERDEGRGREAG
jgi:hypothetical protein